MFSMLVFLVLLTACSIQQNQNIYDNDNKILKLDDYKTYESIEGGVEENNAYISFKDYDGIDTLFVFSGSQTVTITVYDYVTDGRFKVVLIDPYNNVKELKETTRVEAIEGQYKVKVVGDHASGAVSINLELQVSFYPLSNKN
jgi:hypothetical protein